VVLDSGRKVTGVMITAILDESTETLADTWADLPHGKELLADSRNLLYDLCTTDRFSDFLTVPAYELLP
jgi:malate synthase